MRQPRLQQAKKQRPLKAACKHCRLPYTSGDMVNLNRTLVPAAWMFYLVIVFEILYMISPFALYFYSAYGPWLNLFHHSAQTAWLTGFFLPHFSQTTSPVLNLLPKLSDPLVWLGAGVFALGFVQIYAAKILRRGAVTGGLYRFIRHPQYAALAIVGLGTLIHWPRFLVLLMFVTMLFLYYFLARHEEERCVQKFGESYRAYQAQTGMFFPGGLFKRAPAVLPASGWQRLVAALALYAVVLVATVGIAQWLRDYSLSRVSTHYADNMAIISPAVLTQDELVKAARIAQDHTETQRALGSVGPNAKLLVYVVPIEWKLPDIPMETTQGGHYTPENFDRRFYKVLFTRVRTHEPAAEGKEIITRAYGRDPIVLVKVNVEAGQITSIETPPPHVRWGDIPTPLF
ncbi:MAG: isoprenylcysteine carboxylmethyltransferase family protein [Acidobacteriota bacterium]|nr:isoprenylcysteine carboxylmethyltransferase family protein [Blastocatellia bacterium]MDW8240252.1 isoprenylcysteine carboxylmethyltransferase family protein [Acidobacteriota bacterium]